MKDILCLYYSRTGLTEKAMEILASELDAELVRYTDGIDRSGITGYIRSCFTAAKLKAPLDIVTQRPLCEYRCVIVGMPTWVETPCSIGKGLLAKYRNQFPKNVHIVVTHMAPLSYEKRIKKLDRLLCNPMVSYLSLCTKHENTEEIKQYAKTIL